jgi:hypothetical protein
MGRLFKFSSQPQSRQALIVLRRIGNYEVLPFYSVVETGVEWQPFCIHGANDVGSCRVFMAFTGNTLPL